MVDIYFYNEETNKYELKAEAGSQLSDAPDIVLQELTFEDLVFRGVEVFPQRYEKRELVGKTSEGRGMFLPTVIGLESAVSEMYPVKREIEMVIDYVGTKADQKKYDIAAIMIDISAISTDDKSLTMVSYSMIVSYFSRRKQQFKLVPFSSGSVKSVS